MIRGVLIDLSGVLYTGDRVLPGALEAVRRLAATGLPVRYITNTTRSPRATILARLERLGFQADADVVFTAPVVARMVGDDVEADVIGAIEAGLEALLVRTGKYRAGDEQKLADKAACVADIGEAVERLLAMT